LFQRRNAIAALVAALSIFVAPAPAGAESDSIDDPSNDVEDLDGTAATSPAIDITGVSVTSDLDGIEATIEVAEIVPFDDERWENLDLLISVVLVDPGNDDVSGSWTWGLGAFDGDPFAILQADDGSTGCSTDVAQTATAYVVSGDADCAALLPRTLSYGAIGIDLSDDMFLADAAPDGDEMAGPVAAAAAATSTRLAGTDRTLTAIALSQDSFPGDASADTAVLASATSFPDALAGGPLAFNARGPMLLTGAGGLDGRVRTELERVLAPGATVYVLGGTAALSDAVLADVRAAGFDPQRVAGTNRFETAVAIADQSDELTGGHFRVFIADGRAFADALIAGAAAPRQLAVVLLTDGSTMPAATNDYLGSDDTDHIAIGTAAGGAAPGVRRIVGANPSELSVNVSEELAPIRGSVAIASQATFADALAGGPHIAALGGPLLLTDPQTLSPATRDALAGASTAVRAVSLYGGTAAISPGVEQAIDAALAS
jgi:putative cell wall-binding protein